MPGEYSYGESVAIAVDQLINALLNGFPDEALSSAAYRMSRDGVRDWPRSFIDHLFFWQDEHCRNAYLSEVERRQLPPEFRK